MPGPDPRFPDRPQHPDFSLLSEAVCENDDNWSMTEALRHQRIAQFIDLESLRYLAWNRAGVASRDPEIRAQIAGGIMDGFLTGCAYIDKKRGLVFPSPAPPIDGQRRTRSSS